MRDFPFYLILIAIAVILLRVDFFFTVLYFLAAIYILSRLWIRRAASKLRVERSYTDRAFAGDQVEVKLRVRNTGWLPLVWLRLMEVLPVQLDGPRLQAVVTLGTHSLWEREYTFRARQRGYYMLGPLRMDTGDLFGLSQLSLTAEEPSRLIVYPRVVPIEQLGLPTNSPLIALPSASPLFEDPARITGVRDYQRGDSLRRVHWPATARMDRLVVKRYQPAIAHETLICLDMNEEDYALRRRYYSVELAIVAAASVATHIAVGQGLPVGLRTTGMDPLAESEQEFAVPPRSGRAHLVTNILEVLARIQPGTASFTDLLERSSVGLAWGSTVAAITGRLTEELATALLFLQQKGFAVVLLLVQPEGSVTGVPGVTVHQITDEQDLEVLV